VAAIFGDGCRDKRGGISFAQSGDDRLSIRLLCEETNAHPMASAAVFNSRDLKYLELFKSCNAQVRSGQGSHACAKIDDEESLGCARSIVTAGRIVLRAEIQS
jgi:hypothetical protein